MAEINEEQVPVAENNTPGFYERLTALPVVSEAMNQTGAIYNAVKGRNGLTQYACDTGESVAKRVTTTAYNVGAPIAGIALKVAEPYVGNPGQYFTIYVRFNSCSKKHRTEGKIFGSIASIAPPPMHGYFIAFILVLHLFQ